MFMQKSISLPDFAFKYSADIYVGFERFYEINHEILQVILHLKKCKYKKKIGARYLSFLLTQVYKNFTVSSLELK